MRKLSVVSIIALVLLSSSLIAPTIYSSALSRTPSTSEGSQSNMLRSNEAPANISDSYINMQILHTFDVYTNSSNQVNPRLDSNLTALIQQSVGPPSGSEGVSNLTLLTVSDPITIFASPFNVTILKFHYTYSLGETGPSSIASTNAALKSASRFPPITPSGDVAVLRFELDRADSKIVAISSMMTPNSQGAYLWYHGPLLILSWLNYVSKTANISGVLGDSVVLHGLQTLPQSYRNISSVMNWAATNMYVGSDNASFAALGEAYLDMANCTQLIAHLLEVTPTLQPYGKAIGTTFALLIDPTWFMTGNWWIRLGIKVALYFAILFVVYGIWTLFFGGAPLAMIILGAVAGAMLANVFEALPLACYMIAMVIRITEPLWGWLAWIPEAIAWIFENIPVWLFGYAALKYRAVLYAATGWASPLFWAGIWLFVSTVLDWILDVANLWRDY